MSIFSLLLLGVAILSFLYMAIIIAYVGIHAAQLWFWPLIGVLCICVSALDIYVKKTERPLFRWIEMGTIAVGVVGIIILTVIEIIILSYHSPKLAEDPNYILVLGAKVNGTKASKALVERLDCAVEYANEHPNSMIVVSGGQGQGEDVSEAVAMKDYLVRHDIDQKRIIEEDRSTNTEENFRFSWAKINDETASVVVISNRFHVYRAVLIGKKMGIKNIYGKAAVTDPIMRVHYYLREAVAVLKYKVKGTI